MADNPIIGKHSMDEIRQIAFAKVSCYIFRHDAGFFYVKRLLERGRSDQRISPELNAQKPAKEAE